MIEAIRRRGPGYVAAVQWHPEFHSTEHGTFDDTALLHDFLAAARATRKT
jgi:putative glutamine amidotransferase